MIDKNDSIYREFIRFFEKRGSLKPPLPYAVAISGGIDSVVLAELCRQAGFNFFLVHCNFQLRGEESKRDEKFVVSIAHKYNVPILVKHFETEAYAKENKLSIQEAARNLRYEWFLELHKEKKAWYTLLAHHADDNIETVLMNFFRGTGMSGLTGMPEVQPAGHCLRPMIKFNRQEIMEFASLHNLEWVEDSSNKMDKYTRNFFRNTLLPQISTVFPKAKENILNNIDRFKKTEALYNDLLKGYKKKIGRHTESGALHLPVQWLSTKKDTSLIYEIIKDYGFGEKAVGEVIKLLDSDTGKFIFNEHYKIIKHGKWLIIAGNTNTSDPIPIDKDLSVIRFNTNKQLDIKLCTGNKIAIHSDPLSVQLDAKEITWPLLLRKWKQGDYFYPLGMRKKKKVARFLIDLKLRKDEKEKVWIMESNKKILWIVGLRIDDRFKIMPDTKNVLQLNVSTL